MEVANGSGVMHTPGLILIMLMSLIIGVTLLLSPVTGAKVVMLWPKFLSTRLFRPEDFSPKAHRALRLIDEDPEAYQREFRTQMRSFRLTGFIALFIFLCSMCAFVANYTG